MELLVLFAAADKPGMPKEIQFRPHHFLCAVAYKSLGYSKRFIRNFDQIAEQIRRDEHTKIQVIFGLDTICSACPHQDYALSLCKNQEIIEKLDYAHARILNLCDHEILTFREAKERIKKYFSLKKFYKACEACEWQKSGICEDALKKLKNL